MNTNRIIGLIVYVVLLSYQGECITASKLNKRQRCEMDGNGRMVCSKHYPLPAMRSLRNNIAPGVEVGKRVYDGGYQETLPEVLEDFVPGIKPDDGMCRMEEAFQLLSTNWQDIITLVFKLGLADVGSERK
ncbi:uncharacterized protein [Antedon mediterranea]|uniref:uncharacterized protein isoform X2 n=1 Tax=Antedon mediterranea TaxID=105859 RepID=UPI003AF442A3